MTNSEPLAVVVVGGSLARCQSEAGGSLIGIDGYVRSLNFAQKKGQSGHHNRCSALHQG